MTKNLEKISVFLIYIFPFLIVSGPFLSDFGLVVICILFLIISFRRDRLKVLKNKFFFLFFCFYTYLVVRSLFTEEWMSIKSALFFFRFGLFVFAIHYFLKNKILLIENFIKSLLILLFIIFIDSSIQFITQTNLLGYYSGHEGRVSSLFFDEWVLGSFSVRVFLIIIPICLKLYNKTILSFFAFVLILLLVLASGERTATALILIYTFFYLFFVFKNYKTKIIIITSLVILSSSILFFNEHLRKRIIFNTIINFHHSETFNIVLFSQPHSEHYQTGLKMFKDSYLFGQGPKMFRIKCSDKKYNSGQFSCGTHPHNILIQFLAEFGLVGLIFLLIFYIYLGIYFIKVYRLKNDYNNIPFLILSISVFINFFPFFPYGNFLNNWLSIMNILSISLLGYFYSDSSK